MHIKLGTVPVSRNATVNKVRRVDQVRPDVRRLIRHSAFVTKKIDRSSSNQHLLSSEDNAN